jgi:hypothetical protein
MLNSIFKRSHFPRWMLLMSIVVGSSFTALHAVATEPDPAGGNPDTPAGGGTFVYNPGPMPDQETPGFPFGGPIRSTCPDTATPLTALVPYSEEQLVIGQQSISVYSVWGLTSEAHPTFWFYVPYSLTADLSGQFSLKDEQGNPVYDAIIDDFAGPGVLSVTIPDSNDELAVGEMYQWSFQVDCSAGTPIFTEGWIGRVADVEVTTDAYNRAIAYAEQGIWYDAVSGLAELRIENPTNSNLEGDWASLLESAWGDVMKQEDLDTIINAPIADCCTAP